MFIAIDIGKTNTRVASSKDMKTVLKVERFPTNPSIMEQKRLLKEFSDKLAEGESIKAAVIGVPGIIDKVNGSFYKINTYPELNGLPFIVLTDETIKCQEIYVQNDALLAGLGEAARGSGKEFDIVSYLTLSTGVGGARIVFKEIDPTYYFMEPGHQIIVHDGKVDPFCGQKGCLQAYLSGPAFEETYKVKPEDCADEAIWAEYSKYLASVVINIISMWSPEVIVIGGGVSQKFDFFYPGLIENLGKQNFFPIPEIRKAAFGDDSGIHGGFAYLSKVTEKGL